jgi:hypothetical protein
MLAASSRSFGDRLQNCRSRKMLNAPPPKKRRNDQRFQRIQPPQLGEQQVGGDEGYLAGQHHRGQHDGEQQPVITRPEASKAVRHDSGGKHSSQRRRQRHDQRIDRIPRKIRVPPALDEVFKGKRLRNQAWRQRVGFRRQLERRRNHPQKRKKRTRRPTGSAGT